MASPALSPTGMLLSQSQTVPPASMATATTTESNEQSPSTTAGAVTGVASQQLAQDVSLAPPSNNGASPASAVNGSNPSLAAGGTTPTPAAATVAGSAKKKKEGAGGPPKSKAYANPLASRADEIKYRTKYKQLRGKVKEIEEENAKMQAKILKTKRQIQRLRLERSILYDRFQEAKNSGTLENTSIPVSSLQAQLTSVPFGSLNGDLSSSTSMQQHSPHAHHQHQQSHFSPSHQHISHHQPPQPPSSVFHQHQLQNDLSSQGYHPSHFITQPGLMHDGSDTLMLNALHHNLQGVDQSMSMSL